MLTVMMDCGTDSQGLAASLAALVPGAVDGLVREVVLFDRDMNETARRIADHAGCRVLPPDRFRAAMGEAKGEWLLLLEPGARPLPGWIEAVRGHLETSMGPAGARPARFARSKLDRPGFLRRFGTIRTALAEGLLVPKPQAVGLSKIAMTLEEMAKGLFVRRLNAEIRPRAS